nr:DUF3499 domain-containing protein [Nakamurella leprariae]
MARLRRCSRTGCTNAAVATLTYAYADSTAVVGPLATAVEPHSYDLCATHAQHLTVPKGWEVVRPDGDLGPVGPRVDDLEALADAVREAGRQAAQDDDPLAPTGPGAANAATGGGAAAADARRAHLRVLRFPEG